MYNDPFAMFGVLLGGLLPLRFLSRRATSLVHDQNW
jgi:hypothetical protein